MRTKKNSKILETSLNNEGILRLNLNCPENSNALSENMIDLIRKNIDRAGSDKRVRVIIISSEGSTFSSGHDLKEMKLARNNADKGKIFLKNNEKMFEYDAGNY